MTWGWHGFKKGNNFLLSTPTVRKDVKMLRTQVEPRAAGKCGFTQVWHRFKHFDLVSTVGKNVNSRPINAREIAQLLEKLL